MKLLEYRNQELHFGLKQTPILSFLKNYEHPFYLYDLPGIQKRFDILQKSFQKKISIHYAMKANYNVHILSALAEAHACVDVVSIGEMKAALMAGFRSDQIIFSGVGKTQHEISFAIQNQIRQINVESPSELRRIAKISQDLKKSVEVCFRMNPDVNPETHPYITTGFRENKFGMDESFLPELLEILQQSSWVQLVGLTIHIGSQILDLKVLREAIVKTKPIYLSLKEKGFPLSRFDVGGGLGIDYQHQDLPMEHQMMQDYAKIIEAELSDLDCEIQCEPGRWLVGHFGVLVAQVQYIKKTQYKNFVILDTGMNHLMRPSLYKAYHKIFAVKLRDGEEISYDVVGPICESSDFIGMDRKLSPLQEGDFVLIADAGAYGYAMASEYNLHQLPQELIIDSNPPI